MEQNLTYAIILVISGAIASGILISVLARASHKLLRSFQLYPESRGVMDLALKFITWFIGLCVFLVFLRWALLALGLSFTTRLVEEIIVLSPRYILAALILLCGFYVTRIIRERSKGYDFEYKNRALLAVDVIVHMTFAFSALYMIGVNVMFFLEFYKVVLWSVAAIIILVVSMTIGIPLGISTYRKMGRNSAKERK